VIGTGASAFQFVPDDRAPRVGQLTVFSAQSAVGPCRWRTITRTCRRASSWLHRQRALLRQVVPASSCSGRPPRASCRWSSLTRPGTIRRALVSQVNAELREMVSQYLEAQVADHPELVGRVVPGYPIGGKRAVLDKRRLAGRAEAAQRATGHRQGGQDHAQGRGHRRRPGIRGRRAVYGTGFQASQLPVVLQGEGQGRPRPCTTAGAATRGPILGITVPKLPRTLHHLRAQHQHRGQRLDHLLTPECAVRYIVGCLRLLAENGGCSPGGQEGRPRRLQRRRGRGQTRVGPRARARHQLVQERLRPGQPELAVRPDRLLACDARPEPG